MKRRRGELSGPAREAGISVQTLSYRLRRGWTMERAISTPARHIGLSVPETIEAYFDQILRDGFTDCWIWPGAVNGGQGPGRKSRGGYASVRVGGRHRLLHVVLWERIHGPVPEGLELDHLCRMTRCCNPDHLEAVTHLVNVRRGLKGGKTHCKRGHAFTPENTIHIGGTKWPRRACRTCQTERNKRLWQDPKQRAKKRENNRAYYLRTKKPRVAS